MKIYFNRRPVDGPWGGGSKVLSSIIEECKSRNFQLFFEEEIKSSCIDFDILFCIDPRPSHLVSYIDLLEHKNKHNSKIIQRVGDLGTHGKPELFEIVKKTSQLSDVLIFPSNWAKNYLNSKNENTYVISNAPLHNFNIEKKPNKTYDHKIKIVSHHWSDNHNKGFEIYKELDDYCRSSNKFEFIYIGRKPKDISFINELPPQDVSGLVENLPQHHIYVTASKLEAGANHVLEALACHLPVLYHCQGGSINEYCKNFGIEYNSSKDLIHKLENSIEKIKLIYESMNYSRNSKMMAKEYVDLLESLI